MSDRTQSPNLYYIYIDMSDDYPGTGCWHSCMVPESSDATWSTSSGTKQHLESSETGDHCLPDQTSWEAVSKEQCLDRCESVKRGDSVDFLVTSVDEELLSQPTACQTCRAQQLP